MIRLLLLSTVSVFSVFGLLLFATDLTIVRESSLAQAPISPTTPEVTRAPVQPAPASSSGLADFSAAIIAGLDVDGTSNPSLGTNSQAPVQDLSRAVLASIGATSASASDDFGALILQALNEGDSDAGVDAILNAAVAEGQIAVPAALRTADGRLDTTTLLRDIVARSSGAGPAPAPSRAEIAQSEGVEVSSGAEEVLVYTVRSGDSLGAIAQRFYGDAAIYTEIYAANRGILSSPNRISVGQRLRLPNL